MHVALQVWDWPVRRGKRYCGTHGHHWWANPHRATATNRTASGQDRTVSFGIRTVNPGFYLPGIEVYSVLSSPRPCASYPSRTCVLSYVQPSCGKTFAYLRFSIRRRERRRGKCRKTAPSLRLRSSPSLVCRCPWSSSISLLGPSSFASLVCEMRPSWKTHDIFCLSPLSSLFLPFCPAGINWLSGELNLSDGPALSNAPT